MASTTTASDSCVQLTDSLSSFPSPMTQINQKSNTPKSQGLAITMSRRALRQAGANLGEYSGTLQIKTIHHEEGTVYKTY